MRPTLILVAVVLTAGCVHPGAPVPVLGDRAELVGEWQGIYQNPRNARSGNFWFHFAPGTDSARGEVTMLVTPPRQLRITFVWGGEKEITGRLDPYVDPVSRELIYTMFEGRLDGSRLIGTFSTLYPDGGWLLEGTWSASRKPRGP